MEPDANKLTTVINENSERVIDDELKPLQKAVSTKLKTTKAIKKITEIGMEIEIKYLQ